MVLIGFHVELPVLHFHIEYAGSLPSYIELVCQMLLYSTDINPGNHLFDF